MKPVGVSELLRRSSDLRRRIGSNMADQRLETGVTQRQLATCAGIDQGFLSRIEAGEAKASLDVLLAIATCLGSELGVRLFPTAGPRLHDRFQAPMIDALIRLVGPGWRTTPEVPVRAARGVVDLLLARRLDHLTVVCECHSELRRLELVMRRMAEKTGALQAEATAGAVSSTLLLRSTRATREIAKAYEATLAAAFPARTADVLDALRGSAAWPGPGIVWATVEAGRAEILDAPPRGVRLGR
jgi:DNA-binding XRE family transcriptional regulator